MRFEQKKAERFGDIDICAIPSEFISYKDPTGFSLGAQDRLDFQPAKNLTQDGLTCANHFVQILVVFENLV